jgi:hypothetical protein
MTSVAQQLSLALSKGPSRAETSFPSHEDGNRFSFQHDVLYSYLEFQMIDKSIKLLILKKLRTARK